MAFCTAFSFFWLSVVLLGKPVSTLQYIAPPETISATATADWSPRPTGANPRLELLKRDTYPASLCGWQGPEYQNVYCSSNSFCAWFTDIKAVGCCSIGGSCDAVYSSCIDWKMPAPSISFPGVFTCTGNSVCYTNSYPDGYTELGCGTDSIGQTVVTSWTGMNAGQSLYITYTAGAVQTRRASLISTTPLVSPHSPPVPPPTTTVTSKQSAQFSTMGQGPKTISVTGASTTIVTTFVPSGWWSGSKNAVSPSTNSSTAAATTSSSSGLSTNAKIAIGVVVGVTAILVAAGVAFWCFIHGRKQGKKQKGQVAEMSPGDANATSPPFELNEEQVQEKDGGQSHQLEKLHGTPVLSSVDSHSVLISPHSSNYPSSATATTASSPHLPHMAEICELPGCPPGSELDGKGRKV